MGRFGGIVFDLLPQLHDEVVDGPRRREVFEPPHFIQKSVTGHHFATRLDQQTEYVKLARRQLNRLAGASGLKLLEVELNLPEGITGQTIAFGPGRAPQSCPNSRDELPYAK